MQIFDVFDVDKSGSLEFDEFYLLVRSPAAPLLAKIAPSSPRAHACHSTHTCASRCLASLIDANVRVAANE
jgi:hypothetical protein